MTSISHLTLVQRLQSGYLRTNFLNQLSQVVHSEPFPTSKMGRFVGIVKALVQNISTIFTKNSMLEILLSSEYASV